MASGAAVAGDYYVRGGSRRCSPLIRFKQKAKGRNKVASSTWLRVSLACFGTQLPMRLRSIGTWYAPTPRICSPRYPLFTGGLTPHICPHGCEQRWQTKGVQHQARVNREPTRARLPRPRQERAPRSPGVSRHRPGSDGPGAARRSPAATRHP